MDSLTRRGCVTLWKSESSLDYRPPELKNTPASPRICRRLVTERDIEKPWFRLTPGVRLASDFWKLPTILL